MSPEAYFESLRRASDFIKLNSGEWLLDAGCGSGLVLSFLKNLLEECGRYLGMDILAEGLDSLKLRTNRLNLNNYVSGVQVNLLKSLPLKDSSVSCVIAHFSIYKLKEKEDRSQVYREFWRVLKPGGLLITSNPTHTYDAEQIIRSSVEQLRDNGKTWIAKKYLVYPRTLRFGLRHIERQLKSGKWHSYQPGELQDEVAQAGFSIEHSESVYGESGILVTGRKT